VWWVPPNMTLYPGLYRPDIVAAFRPTYPTTEGSCGYHLYFGTPPPPGHYLLWMGWTSSTGRADQWVAVVIQ
jgi:hypothetical protein